MGFAQIMQILIGSIFGGSTPPITDFHIPYRYSLDKMVKIDEIISRRLRI
jgi:hypothetical protein